MKKVDYYNFFLLNIKMSETTYFQRNRDVTLNRTKERLRNISKRNIKQ